MVDHNEVWVFLSHSNKDYEKVCLVRNILEKQSLRPLMFFLQCLNDEDEIDSLIKREIDCRTRFILCDSSNARQSKWVQKEVEYIKSQNRICETIDIDKDVSEISVALQEFIKSTRIFISYNRENFELADIVYKRLSQYDFSVYIDRFWDSFHGYKQNYGDAVRFIDNLTDNNNGYMIAIMGERILNRHSSSSRYEIVRAINNFNNHREGKLNVIPFVTKGELIESIENDREICQLLENGIQSLGNLDIESQCNIIIERVVMQLMTPGSIKVQAEIFEKGINCSPNTSEANFLYEILRKYNYI